MNQFADLVSRLFTPVSQQKPIVSKTGEPLAFGLLEPTQANKDLQKKSQDSKVAIEQNITQPIKRIASAAQKTAVAGVMAGFEAVDKLAGAGVAPWRIQGTKLSDRYGSAPLLTDVASQNVESGVLKAGFHPTLAKSLGGLAGFAVGLIEPLPGPKTLSKLLGKDLLTQMVKADTTDAAMSLLKKHAPELTDKQLNNLSPKIATAKSHEAVRFVLGDKSAAKGAETPMQSAIETVESPQHVEARKYKTADEYVSVDKEKLTDPGLIQDPERLKTVVRTREAAEKLEEDYTEQLFRVADDIADAGGRSAAPSRLILAKKDAESAIRNLRAIKDGLPTEAAARDLHAEATKPQNVTPLTGDQLLQNAEYKASKREQARKESEPKAQGKPVPVVVRSKKQDISETSDVVRQTAQATGRKPKEVSGKLQAFRRFATQATENIQDEATRVKQLIQKKGMKVSDDSNPYQKITNYPGRVQARIDNAYERIEGLVKDMNATAKGSGKNLAGLRKDVNEYLVMRHAPERNVALGDGAAGVTTSNANIRLGQLESGKNGAKIKEFADRIQEINRESLTMLRDSGVISKELYETLTTRYKNHVPLQRVMDDTDDIGSVLSGKGYDVRGTGVKRAKGSSREVADILTNVATNYEQAVLRAEKNNIDNATLKFVRDNEAALKGTVEIQHPRPKGRAFGKDGKEGPLLMETTNDPSVLQFFEDGKKIWLKFKDPNLAEAFRGIGAEKVPGILKASRAFVNLYSGLATRFNLDFALPNKVRDLQETAIYLASQKDVGVKGAAKVIGRDAASTKDVLDGIRGKNTPGAQLYREMRMEGGTTGGFALSSRKQAELNIEKIEKLATSKTRKVASNLIETVDNWNTLFEDSTRLSVYKTAREKGLSKARAAELAKNASINFNRHGKWGPVINSLYMFSNASIQGSAKMFESLKDPKVLAAVSTTVAASVTTINSWNDQVDPEWRDKVTKWDRLNGLPVMIPSEDGGVKYFTIPVSWGVKPMKVMFDYAYDASTGHEVKAKDFLGNTLSAMANAYNPVGGTNFTSAIVPTIADVPVEVYANESWSGSKIRNDYDPSAPKDMQYFSSLGDTASGRTAISLSELLQKHSGIEISPADINYYYEQYSGGAGRAATKIVNTAIGAAQGKLPPADNFPIFGRFYKERTAEELGQGAGGQAEKAKTLVEQQSRERSKLSMQAENEYERLKGLPKEQAAKEWQSIFDKNPDLAKKITEMAKDEKLGLTYTDRTIKKLGVENGERAKFIVGELKGLKTKEEKAAYWDELSSKKLLTKDVAKQIRLLLKEQ